MGENKNAGNILCALKSFVLLEGNDKSEKNLCYHDAYHKSETKLLEKKKFAQRLVPLQTVEI